MLLVDRDDAEVAPLDHLAVRSREAERLAVERATRREVGDVDLDVVEHVSILT